MVFSGWGGCGGRVVGGVVEVVVVEGGVVVPEDAVGVVFVVVVVVVGGGVEVVVEAVVEGLVAAVVVVVLLLRARRLAMKLGRRMRGGCEQRRRMGRWKARVCAVQRPRKKMYWRTSGCVERSEGASFMFPRPCEEWLVEKGWGAAFSMRAQVR